MVRTFNRLLTTISAASVLLCGPSLAQGQSYPDHVVRIVVPFAPGGGTDASARIVAQKLQDALGKPFIVENRPGAGGVTAVESVVRSAPDGHTLFITTNGPIVVAPNYQKVGYDALKDLTPVGMVAIVGSAVAVPASSPINTLADLVKASKAKPEGFSYSHPGVGTHMHVGGELLRAVSGANLVGVAYRGTGPTVTALLTGEVPAGVADLTSLLPSVQAGKVRAIAVTNSTRRKSLPNVPTIAESGYPSYDNPDSWFGMFAPAGTPPAVVNRLNLELRRVMGTEQVQETFAKLGLETSTMTPEEMRRFIATDFERWKKLIKTANIKTE